MSYVFTPSLTAALTVSRKPTTAVVAPSAPAATGDVYPEVPAELFATSLEQRLLQPTGDFNGGVKRGLFTVLVAILAAETDRAISKRKKRFDGRYALIAALTALVAREIIE